LWQNEGETYMHVYLLRHGIAEDERPGLSDADRSLTLDGRRKLRHVLKTLAEAGQKPTLILSSPLKRAVQTAEIAGTVLGYDGEILRSKFLVPGGTPEQVWEEIRAHRAEEGIMLVGHNPLFDALGPYLLGTPSLQMDFKKGAILRVDIEAFGAQARGILRYYLIAKLSAGRD
jgi:phosphohistidine phosphatase